MYCFKEFEIISSWVTLNIEDGVAPSTWGGMAISSEVLTIVNSGVLTGQAVAIMRLQMLGEEARFLLILHYNAN